MEVCTSLLCWTVFKISHLGKTLISPNWWNQFCSNLLCWKEDRQGYLSAKFQTQRSSTFRYIAETISRNSAEEIEETRASDILQFWSQFWENEYTAQLALRRCIFLSNKVWKIPQLKNYGFSVKPQVYQKQHSRKSFQASIRLKQSHWSKKKLLIQKEMTINKPR